jgi:hypothetical protein
VWDFDARVNSQFLQLAEKSERQIALIGGAVMFPCEEMIDFVFHQREAFRDAVTLTAT